MFELVTKHKLIAQIILALIMIPFAFFGVDYYFRGDAADGTIATVGDQKITQNEFSEAIREQQEQMRQQMGKSFDPSMFENAEVRFALLQQLINQKLLLTKARKENFQVTDAQLQQFIAAIPTFQEDGRFSAERYRQVLLTQNMSPPMFEQRLRQDLLLGAVQEPLASSNIVARQSAAQFVGLLEQQREIALALVDPQPFMKDAKVDDAQVREFYEKNTAAFQTPEQARIEYLLLTQEALIAQVVVDPAEVRKTYDGNVRQYTANEERSAAHILIAVKPDAKEDEKAAAKKRADEVYARAKAAPEKFAELAREYSQDPGSAGQGGDLGSFARGSMVKPFEDAVFAANAGDLLAPVQSDFGWHVIKVGSVREARTLPFDEVKAQIEADLKRQRATQKFATAAEQFQNLVYEQADSLNGVAKVLELKVETTPFISREQAQAIGLGSAKFVAALFSLESVQSKRNTEAIEVGPGTLIAGRVVEHKPAAPIPFAEVQQRIREQLTRRAAGELAQAEGARKLKLLEEGKDEKAAGVVFAVPAKVGRGQFQPGLPPALLTRVFQTGADKLPAFVGGPNEQGGFSIVKLLGVISPSESDKARLDQASARLSEQIGRELLTAYLASLRAQSDVKLNQANLEKR